MTANKKVGPIEQHQGDSNELNCSQGYFPLFDAVSAWGLLMSVIIMHPKHNLEMKPKKREADGAGEFVCVYVCVCVFGGGILFSGSCCEAECKIQDRDVMKMDFLF